MVRVNDLIEKVQTYSPDADIRMLVDAYLYSAHAHTGQKRKSGEAYLTHPLAVACLLADMKMDIDTIATGLLHDTMEDCMTSHDDIRERFGEDVADLVDGVTKIGKLKFKSKEIAQAENFRKMILAMSKDVRVVLVKLADRLHNMQTMKHMKPNRQKAISQETIDIYAPIANRLGLSKIKGELEDLCFRYLEPEMYFSLQKKLEERAPDHKIVIDSVQHKLEKLLVSKKVKSEIYGRVKHMVSIYRKLKNQNLEFSQLHDLLAFRVIVEDIGACYVALGLIHGQYHHHPDRLKDYIAQPKSNGYQSLHTVIIVEGQQYEVQIRTNHMHQVAELGIAAHWRYKEGHLALSKNDIQKIARLRALFEAAQEVTDPEEFLETLKVDLFSREIFVFTPNGDVKIFPQNATALDFAYAIHTEVGDQCTGAKVNGKMEPLRYQLQNGDRVEILTNPKQQPNRDWLDIAKTGRAISKIRRFIREEDRIKTIELGKDILDKELQKHNLTINKLSKTNKLLEGCQKFGHRTPEQLYLAIASGTTGLNRLIKFLLPESVTPPPSTFTNFINKIRNKPTSPVLINGENNVMTSFAHCCNPLPGEKIVGFITRGRGITIHKAECKQLIASDPDRRISVQWHTESKNLHSAELELICSNQMGLLADLGAVCKTNGVNVTRMEAKTINDNRAKMVLEVSISNADALKKLLRSIRKISGVLQASRVFDQQYK